MDSIIWIKSQGFNNGLNKLENYFHNYCVVITNTPPNTEVGRFELRLGDIVYQAVPRESVVNAERLTSV